jgi:hypothetical protein
MYARNVGGVSLWRCLSVRTLPGATTAGLTTLPLVHGAESQQGPIQPAVKDRDSRTVTQWKKEQVDCCNGVLFNYSDSAGLSFVVVICSVILWKLSKVAVFFRWKCNENIRTGTKKFQAHKNNLKRVASLISDYCGFHFFLSPTAFDANFIFN